jgi:hypothetical protein
LTLKSGLFVGCKNVYQIFPLKIATTSNTPHRYIYENIPQSPINATPGASFNATSSHAKSRQTKRFALGKPADARTIPLQRKSWRAQYVGLQASDKKLGRLYQVLPRRANNPKHPQLFDN